MKECSIIRTLNARNASRALDESPLPENAIETLIEAVRLTPSCRNNQPWRLEFLSSPDALECGRRALTRGNQLWASRAPLLVVVHTRRDDDCVTGDGRAYHRFDAGLASMNLMLAATDMGLIARPMAGFDQDNIRSALGLDDDVEPILMIAVGRQSSDQSHLPEDKRDLDLAPRRRMAPEEIATVR